MKTCLVLEGGAMRGMYTAGALDVFYNAGIQFDGIIGVSAKRRNFGRTILENIIGSGFDKDRIVILRDGEPDPSGAV